MPGCEVLRREMDHLTSEWQDYNSRIQQAEEDLEHALLQWGDFETKFDACSKWLKNMEQQVKNYELKSTLPEKKTQVEKFKVRFLSLSALFYLCSFGLFTYSLDGFKGFRVIAEMWKTLKTLSAKEIECLHFYLSDGSVFCGIIHSTQFSNESIFLQKNESHRIL